MPVAGARPVRSTRKLFKNTYAITMDPKGRRFTMMKRSAKNAGIKIKQYPGVRITQDQLNNGIPGIPRRFYHRPGVIGCYLAHKHLLEKIDKENMPNDATLIVKDDAIFSKDFLTKVKHIEPEVPDDWDLIYLHRYVKRLPGIQRSFKKGRVSKHLYKINKKYIGSNFGTIAYLVRNKSVKKILPRLTKMKYPIDIQYNAISDKVNMYAIYPRIIGINRDVESNLENINEKLKVGDL
jgi:GR25 family glycosyltransferase involved in LPS biosynthesis